MKPESVQTLKGYYIVPVNEPRGEGNGWDACDDEQATAYAVYDDYNHDLWFSAETFASAEHWINMEAPILLASTAHVSPETRDWLEELDDEPADLKALMIHARKNGADWIELDSDAGQQSGGPHDLQS